MKMNFLSEEKVMVHSQDIQIFVFFLNPRTSKSFIIDITAHQSLQFRLFISNPMWSENEIWSDIISIYKKHFHFVFSSVAKLETSSRPLCDYGEMTISLFRFITSLYFFSILFLHPFQPPIKRQTPSSMFFVIFPTQNHMFYGTFFLSFNLKVKKQQLLIIFILIYVNFYTLLLLHQLLMR